MGQNQTKQTYMRKSMENHNKQALTFLKNVSKEKNTIEIHDFINKYSILFKKIDTDNIDLTTQSKIEKTSKELLSNIDPYSPITLIDDNKNVVTTLPPIFYPVNELNSSVSDIVNKLRLLVNQHLSPIQLDDIYGNLLSSIIQSQLTPEEQESISNGSLSLQDIFESKTSHLSQLFHNSIESIKKAKEQIEPEEIQTDTTQSPLDILEESDEGLSKSDDTFSLLVDEE